MLEGNDTNKTLSSTTTPTKKQQPVFNPPPPIAVPSTSSANLQETSFNVMQQEVLLPFGCAPSNRLSLPTQEGTLKCLLNNFLSLETQVQTLKKDLTYNLNILNEKIETLQRNLEKNK